MKIVLGRIRTGERVEQEVAQAYWDLWAVNILTRKRRRKKFTGRYGGSL